MGYYVSYNIEAQIDMSKEAEALAAINDLHKPEVISANARGGSFSGGERIGVWYSWVENPGPDGFKSLSDALWAWRFSLSDNGDFYFEGGKLGQEEVLFNALAPFMKGTIYARGEDDCEWGYRFRDGRMIELTCERTWKED